MKAYGQILTRKIRGNRVCREFRHHRQFLSSWAYPEQRRTTDPENTGSVVLLVLQHASLCYTASTSNNCFERTIFANARTNTHLIRRAGNPQGVAAPAARTNGAQLRGAQLQQSGVGRRAVWQQHPFPSAARALALNPRPSSMHHAAAGWGTKTRVLPRRFGGPNPCGGPR